MDVINTGNYQRSTNKSQGITKFSNERYIIKRNKSESAIHDNFNLVDLNK